MNSARDKECKLEYHPGNKLSSYSEYCKDWIGGRIPREQGILGCQGDVLESMESPGVFSFPNVQDSDEKYDFDGYNSVNALNRDNYYALKGEPYA